MILYFIITNKISKPIIKDDEETIQSNQQQEKQPIVSGGDYVSIINVFRQCKGLKLLSAATSEQNNCANDSVQRQDYHKSFGKCKVNT